LLGKKWQPVAVPDDVPLIEERLRTLSPVNPFVVVENRVYSGSGEVRWMQFVNRSFFDAAGRMVETQGVGRDITERKQAEEALMRSREDMRLLAARFAEIDEAERKRLSRELHDRVGQTLTALEINLAHVLEEMPSSVPPAVMRRLNEACGQTETLADDIRE